MIQVHAERLTQITNPLVMNSEQRCFFVIRIFEHSVKTGSKPLRKDHDGQHTSELPALSAGLTKVPYLVNELILPKRRYSNHRILFSTN